MQDFDNNILKIGDTVKCVDNDGFFSGAVLEKGALYKVLSSKGVMVTISCSRPEVYFCHMRFIKVNGEKTKNNIIVSYSMTEVVKRLEERGICTEYINEIKKKYSII